VKPFVGRAEELRALEGTLTAGRSAAAIVLGEPGTGKTRLLAEVLGRSRSATILRVQGYETEEPVALVAAAPLLRSLGVLAEASTGPAEPAQIFERVYRAMHAAGAAVLALDDVQWVDDASLGLCQYLVRGAAESTHPLVVLAASRPSPRMATFARSIEDALPGAVTTLELGPLTRDEGVALARILDPRLDAEAATDVWRRAAGSPFWLDALVRSGGGADARRFVTMRLRGATSDAGELLALLAIAARPLAPSEVVEIATWPAQRVDRAATELASRGVALLAPGTLALTHDLIREAAVGELPAETRTRIHRRLAQWLEQRTTNEPQLLREALEHRLAADMPAAELALRLATGAGRRILGREGLHRLIEIADREDSRDLQAAVATLAAEMGEHEIALERADVVADNAGDATTRARWLLAASKAAYRLSRIDEARVRLERAREYQATDAVLTVEIDAHEAAILRWLKSDFESARACTDKAVREARELVKTRPGDQAARDALLRALEGAFDDVFTSDQPTQAAKVADEMIEVTREMSDAEHQHAIIVSTIAVRSQGNLREVETKMRRVWSLANERVLPAVAIEAGNWLARALRSRGKLVEAQTIARETVALMNRVVGTPSFMLGPESIVRALSHFAAISLGDWQTAAAELERAATGEIPKHQRLLVYETLALWLARIDPIAEVARVVDNVERSLADAIAVGCMRCLGEAQLAGVEALARVGRIDAARELMRDHAAAPHEETRIVRNWRACGEAALAAAEGDPSRAVGMLKVIETEYQSMGFEVEALWAKIDRGRCLAKFDRDAAVDVLTDAARFAESLDAKTEALVAEKLLRSLGQRTWRRGTATDTLTEREREITRLVASGASNPEIASRLFLSRKTIERHVSNVLRKVGARNRAELAARASELGVEGAPR